MMTTEAKRIQLWPAGASLNFSGSYPHYKVHGDDGAVRDATPEENKSIQRNELAQNYVNNEIFCVDSSLVDDLIKKEFDGFSIDDIENTYADPSDWDFNTCRDYLKEYGGWSNMTDDPYSMNREELVELLESASIECRDDESVETLCAAVVANIDDGALGDLEAWREQCRETAQDNPAEVFEWWRCSQWLCNRLKSIGECVIDNGYGCWWGRCCTGQGMMMDGTLQQIADEFLD